MNFCVWEHHCQMLVLLSFSGLLLQVTLHPLTDSEHHLLPSRCQPQVHQPASVQMRQETKQERVKTFLSNTLFHRVAKL